MKKLQKNPINTIKIIAGLFGIYILAVTLYMLVTSVVFDLFINDMFTQGIYQALMEGKISQTVHFYALVCSIFTHYVFPAFMVADFFLLGSDITLNLKQLAQVLSFPVMYSIFHSAYGILSGNYLYPFLDPNQMNGWGMVMPSIFILAGIFVLLAYGLVWIRNKFKPVQAFEPTAHLQK